MLDQYKEAVFSDYQEKKNQPNFSLNLLNPAPARLREECLRRLAEGPSTNVHEDILRLFFGPKKESDSYIQIIRNFDTDKFRPLVNFLKGITNDPEDKNIELLAWLIDFELKPYQVWLNTKKKGKPQKHSKPRITWIKIGSIAVAIIFVLVLGVYSYEKIVDPKGESTTPNNEVPDGAPTSTIPENDARKLPVTKASIIESKQCMFWTGDHYEPINCSQVLDDTPIIALDMQKVKRLKRITRPDTLRRKDLSKTWYVKINVDSIEFYTDSGSYPLESKKRLRPLTSRMLDKYPNGYNIYKR
jgi:hypothetical protein